MHVMSPSNILFSFSEATEPTSSGDELGTSLATVAQMLSSSVRNALEDTIAFNIKSSALSEVIITNQTLLQHVHYIIVVANVNINKHQNIEYLTGPAKSRNPRNP